MSYWKSLFVECLIFAAIVWSAGIWHSIKINNLVEEAKCGGYCKIVVYTLF